MKSIKEVDRKRTKTRSKTNRRNKNKQINVGKII